MTMTTDPIRDMLNDARREAIAYAHLVAKIELYAGDAAMGAPEYRLARIAELIAEHKSQQ